MDNNCVIVDFMAAVRSVHKQCIAQNIGQLLDNVAHLAKTVCSTGLIQFIYDSYIDLTIKDSERIRRGLTVSYKLAEVQPSTAIPSMMDSFWESESNKRKLIDCAYEYYQSHPISESLNVVCSGYLNSSDDIREAKSSSDNIGTLEELLALPQEAEAAMRIISHIYWALQNGYNSFVTLTNDTDVLVVLLRYATTFLQMGLKTLYLKMGTGTSTRFLLVHKLAATLGKKKCDNILKARIATGCDWISKVGTKNKALIKEQLLDDFGECDLNR